MTVHAGNSTPKNFAPKTFSFNLLINVLIADSRFRILQNDFLISQTNLETTQ